MSFLEKIQFWKKHDDLFTNDDVLNTGVDAQPLPPLEDPSANNYGMEDHNDPLAHTDPYSGEPLNTNTDPLTPNPYGDQAKYTIPQDPTIPNSSSEEGFENYSSNNTTSSNMEVHDFNNMTPEDRLRDQIDRKYSQENLAKQDALKNNNLSSRSGSPSSRDLEIINLKLDAVKSDVSSITHQLDKIERMLAEQKKSW